MDLRGGDRTGFGDSALKCGDGEAEILVRRCPLGSDFLTAGRARGDCDRSVEIVDTEAEETDRIRFISS